MYINLGSRVVNTYLIPIENEYVLVDTGYSDGYESFRKKLAQNNVDIKSIKYLFLTHAHDDHAGFLNEILRDTDARVILHPLAVEGLQKGQNSFEGGCSSLLAFLFCKILALFGHGEHKYPPIKDEYLGRLITIDNPAFADLNFPFKIIETPGHTKDHISLLVGNDLLCGDAAMNNFPSFRRTIIWIENLDWYKESWDKIIELNPAMCYPAHGKPFKTEDLAKYKKSLDSVKLRPLI